MNFTALSSIDAARFSLTFLYMCTIFVCCCPRQAKDPVAFVKLLLEMRDKYEGAIVQAFGDDKNFRNTLNSVRLNMEQTCLGRRTFAHTHVLVRKGLLCRRHVYQRVARWLFPHKKTTWVGVAVAVAANLQAFEDFMNKQGRSPEYVSLYIDDLLRNKNKDTSEQEMEQRMDKVMSLFR